MNQFLGGLIKIEKSLQVLAVVSVMLLLGYLGVEQLRGDQSASTRSSLQPMMSATHPD